MTDSPGPRVLLIDGRPVLRVLRRGQPPEDIPLRPGELKLLARESLDVLLTLIEREAVDHFAADLAASRTA